MKSSEAPPDPFDINEAELPAYEFAMLASDLHPHRLPSFQLNPETFPMTCSKLSVGVCSLIVMLAMASVGAAAEWESLFNGKDLSGWKGKPEFWRVEDGAITGQTTKENPTKGNTFLIWQGGEIGDFTLKLKYRIVGGNSGIQYRSFEVKPNSFVVGGYQADFEAGNIPF